MSSFGFHPFPDEVPRIPRDRAAVIEASAGTGKTFLIEHLVVDRLLRGDARLEEMLVVTFTERAAAELRRRVQTLIRKVAAAGPRAEADAATAGWTVDDEGRARLAAAARQIDTAPISTIHAFCQRILTEQAFAGGRLLVQENVESRAVFSAAFAETIRQELAVDPELAPYLETYLTVRRSTEDLEMMLYRAHQLRVPFHPPFDARAAAEAARDVAALDLGELQAAVAGHHSTVKAVRDRLQTLHAAAVRFAGDGHLPLLLAALDGVVASNKKGFDYVTDNLAGPARAREPVVALADATVSLETAVATLFLPRVAERVAARKRAAGLYDFDDMLALVRDALCGPRGPRAARHAARAVQAGHRRRVPGHRPDPVGDLPDHLRGQPGPPHLPGGRSQAVDLWVSRRRRRDVRQRLRGHRAARRAPPPVPELPIDGGDDRRHQRRSWTPRPIRPSSATGRPTGR